MNGSVQRPSVSSKLHIASTTRSNSDAKILTSSKSLLTNCRCWAFVTISFSVVLVITGFLRPHVVKTESQKADHVDMALYLSDSVLNETSDEYLPYPYTTHRETPGAFPIHLSPVCGTWQREYLSLHSKTLSENPESGQQRFLVFTGCPNCGIGDHLVGLTSVFLLSIIFKRALLVEWTPLYTSESIVPATFDWVPKPQNLTRYNGGQQFFRCAPQGDYLSVSLNYLNFAMYIGVGDSIERTIAYESVFDCLEGLQNVPMIRISFNKGFTNYLAVQSGKWGDKVRELGLKRPYVSGCLLRSLFKVHPKVLEKAESIRKELRDPRKLSICIHARPGNDDTLFHRLDVSAKHMEQTERLFKCAESLSDYWGIAGRDSAWFFMSSSKALRDHFKQKYPDKVLLTDITPRHTKSVFNDPSVYFEVMVEWHLMSQCDFFVFHDSGLSKSAAFYSLKPNSLFRVGDVDCDPQYPTTLKDVGTSWSGI